MTATTTETPQRAARKVQTEVEEQTHKALRKRQNSIEEGTGARPSLAKVISIALDEWAGAQA